MNITLTEIPIKDVVEGYCDTQEEGVFGFSGNLNIRPKYQREFVYNDEKREAVIGTIMKNFPLNVMYWVKTLFPTYRKEQKGIEWGELYNQYKDKSFNPNELEKRANSLMQDDEVTSKKGVYYYLITGKEKYLNIREFSPSMKRETYEKQNGICPICKNKFHFDEMEGDHITPWVSGSKTEISNCQMLCRVCNREKSNK